MKKTELYRKTTEDLADARTQEKRRRGIVIAIAIIAIFFGLVLKDGSIPLPVYFILGAITGLILWYNKPWAKMSSDEIAESEVLFYLSTQLTEKERTIYKLNQKVSDLYDNLPGDKTGFIRGRREILALDEKILVLYQEIFDISETFEIKDDPVMTQDSERVREEILSLKKDLK